MTAASQSVRRTREHRHKHQAMNEWNGCIALLDAQWSPSGNYALVHIWIYRSNIKIVPCFFFLTEKIRLNRESGWIVFGPTFSRLQIRKLYENTSNASYFWMLISILFGIIFFDFSKCAFVFLIRFNLSKSMCCSSYSGNNNSATHRHSWSSMLAVSLFGIAIAFSLV